MSAQTRFMPKQHKYTDYSHLRSLTKRSPSGPARPRFVLGTSQIEPLPQTTDVAQRKDALTDSNNEVTNETTPFMANLIASMQVIETAPIRSSMVLKQEMSDLAEQWAPALDLRGIRNYGRGILNYESINLEKGTPALLNRFVASWFPQAFRVVLNDIITLKDLRRVAMTLRAAIHLRMIQFLTEQAAKAIKGKDEYQTDLKYQRRPPLKSITALAKTKQRRIMKANIGNRTIDVGNAIIRFYFETHSVLFSVCSTSVVAYYICALCSTQYFSIYWFLKVSLLNTAHFILYAKWRCLTYIECMLSNTKPDVEMFDIDILPPMTQAVVA